MSERPSIEIVTHCWRYSALLKYQIAFLMRNYWNRLDIPSRAPFGNHFYPRIQLTVYGCSADVDTSILCQHTAIELEEVHRLANVPVGDRGSIDYRLLPREELFVRAIGRNDAARRTTASWIWFADADYFFGPKCLKELTSRDPITSPKLIFPSQVQISNDHATGDRYIIASDSILPINLADFHPRHHRRAIGGMQIVPGHIAREHGYCDWPKYQRPASKDAKLFLDTRCDRAFRCSLGTAGTAVDLGDDVYRIRHSKAGRFVECDN